MKRAIAITLAVLAAVAAAAVLTARWGASYVASEVVLPRVESRLGARVGYTAVRPGFGVATVEGLRVEIPEVPEAVLTVRAVTVDLSPWALLAGRTEVRSLALEAPRLTFDGRSEDAVRRLGNFLARVEGETDGSSADGAAGGSLRPDLSVVDGELVAYDARGISFRARGIDASLSAAGDVVVALESLRLGTAPDAPDLLSTGPARLEGDLVARELTVDEARVSGPVLRVTAGQSGAEARGVARAFRAILSDLSGRASPPSGGAAEASSDLGALGRIVSGTTLRLEDGRIDVERPEADGPFLSFEGLCGQLFGGTDREPPSLTLAGRASPGGGTVRVGLTMDGAAPRVHVEVASFRLGDLARDLSRRGLTFDAASLVDADLWVTLTDGRASFRGEIAADRLSASGRLLADQPVEDLHIRLVGSGSFPLAREEIALDTARIFVNGVELGLSGRALRDADHYELDVTVDLEQMECARLLEATPRPVRGVLDALELTGTIGGRIRLAVDSRNLQATVLDLALRNGCEARGRGELAVERLEGHFVQRVLIPATEDREEEIIEFETGPESASWASLSEISPYMVAAVLTTEDGRFWTHDGFNLREIRRALIRDLEEGWPRFGASTVTMQLARNLYLFRGRTAARKLQEAVLTWYLESHLSKEQILALYLNVIEFGPRLYGIRAAAMHYFGRSPGDLSPREAVFLAKLLPNPVGRHESTYERGELSPRWQGMIDRTLAVMLERGHLSEEEYRAAREEPIVFHRPDDPLPPRRTWHHRRARLRDGFDVVVDPWDDGEPAEDRDGEARIPAPRNLEE